MEENIIATCGYPINGQGITPSGLNGLLSKGVFWPEPHNYNRCPKYSEIIAKTYTSYEESTRYTIQVKGNYADKQCVKLQDCSIQKTLLTYEFVVEVNGGHGNNTSNSKGWYDTGGPAGYCKTTFIDVVVTSTTGDNRTMNQVFQMYAYKSGQGYQVHDVYLPYTQFDLPINFEVEYVTLKKADNSDFAYINITNYDIIDNKVIFYNIGFEV